VKPTFDDCEDHIFLFALYLSLPPRRKTPDEEKTYGAVRSGTKPLKGGRVDLNALQIVRFTSAA
jgi:hypothetical protein